METRRLGKTEHLTSVLTFGSFALLEASEAEANATIEMVLTAGVNHFDVSPIYGLAEKHIGDWIRKNGKDFFLGCKSLGLPPGFQVGLNFCKCRGQCFAQLPDEFDLVRRNFSK